MHGGCEDCGDTRDKLEFREVRNRIREVRNSRDACIAPERPPFWGLFEALRSPCRVL